MPPLDDDPIWAVRAFVYRHFAATGRPPTVSDTAEELRMTTDQAETAFRELHQRHALFLDGETASIRIANPFSAVPTPFRVRTDRGISYWANCAWDALGIPAATGEDASVETSYTGTGEPVSFQIRGGQLSTQEGLVHFLVPFRSWYDDLVFT